MISILQYINKSLPDSVRESLSWWVALITLRCGAAEATAGENVPYRDWI